MILEYICGHSHKLLQIFPIPILDSHWGIDTERLGEFYFFFFAYCNLHVCAHIHVRVAPGGSCLSPSATEGLQNELCRHFSMARTFTN